MSADVEENDAHLKKVIIKGPIETLCGSASFFLCALSVVYRGQGLFFSFFLLFVVSGGCGKYCRWGKRQPPHFLSARSSFSYHFLPLSLSFSLSLSLTLSQWKLYCFFLLFACHPAGLWTEIGEREKERVRRTDGEQWAIERWEKETKRPTLSKVLGREIWLFKHLLEL